MNVRKFRSGWTHELGPPSIRPAKRKPVRCMRTCTTKIQGDKPQSNSYIQV